MNTEDKSTQLNVGDVVELRSGSLPMTIAEISGDMAMCVWESREGEMRQKRFPLSILRLIV
jgi:uncharacterized protein YodC (DUF2158 family)